VAGLRHCEALGSPKRFKRQTFVHQLCLDMAGVILLDDRKSCSISDGTQAKSF